MREERKPISVSLFVSPRTKSSTLQETFHPRCCSYLSVLWRTCESPTGGRGRRGEIVEKQAIEGKEREGVGRYYIGEREREKERGRGKGESRALGRGQSMERKKCLYRGREDVGG